MFKRQTEMRRTYERLAFWFDGVLREVRPYSAAMRRTQKLLQRVGDGVPADIMDRVDYYAKRREPFGYLAHVEVGNLSWGNRDMYYFDLMRVAKGFGKRFALNPIFEIVKEVPPMAALVRTRPLAGNHDNSILFPLNRFRHFYFPEDPYAWEDKRGSIAWRGRANGNPARIALLERYHASDKHDVGHIRDTDQHPGLKPFLSVFGHMRHRYIPAFEGVNEATSLKWIMGSNSLAICHPMTYEGWFMEGRLEPGVHYVEVRRDLADLEEKIAHYEAHPEEAKAIVRNANAWVAEFRDAERELLIATLVLLRYAKLTKNNMPEHLREFQDLV